LLLLPLSICLLAVAAKEGSIAALLSAVKAAQMLLPGGVGQPALRNELLLPCLRTMRLLMQSPACRSSLLSEGGDVPLQQLLQGCCKVLEGGRGELREQQQQLAAAAAALTEAAAWQDEEGKCRLVLCVCDEYKFVHSHDRAVAVCCKTDVGLCIRHNTQRQGDLCSEQAVRMQAQHLLRNRVHGPLQELYDNNVDACRPSAGSLTWGLQQIC
jgi:hypothetical protein